MKKFIFRVLTKLNLLRHINFNTSVLINKRKFIVPVNAGVGIGNISISEEWMLKVLGELCLPAEKTFVDVGVNIGQTLIKLKSVNPDIHYIGFEPNPLCVYYSELLVKANNWKNVSIVPAGIADHAQIIQLNYYTNDQTDSCASIIPEFRDENSVIRKSLCACYHPSNIEFVFADKEISVIKIDVEGAELEVIRGFKRVLHKHRPNLLVEILPTYKADSPRLERQQEIEHILDELGYFKYRIHKDENNNFSYYEAIESIGVHDRLDWCDYLFSPTILNI